MTDPPRLRDLPDGASFTRDLLRGAEPTRAFTPADAVRLQTAVAKAGATAAASSWSAAALTVPKALAVVATLATGVVGVRAVTRPTPAAHVVTPAPMSAARAIPDAPTPAIAAPVLAAPSVNVAAPAPSPASAPRAARRHIVSATPFAPSSTPAPAPTLADELRVIDDARHALARDPSAAVDALTAAATRMPAGQLRDERDALLVEALARCNRWSEARQRAEALARRDPQSPQNARVRALLRDAP